MATPVKIILDGNEYMIQVEDGQTILDAAIEAEIDPPFACRVAACCSCKAKLLSGQVHMDDDDPLSEEEIEEGFVLTCQSHPRSQDIILSYDEG